MKAAATGDTLADKHPKQDIAPVEPVALPLAEQRDAFSKYLGLPSHPRHPRRQMLGTLVNHSLLCLRVADQPTTQEHPLAFDALRKKSHARTVNLRRRSDRQPPLFARLRVHVDEG